MDWQAGDESCNIVSTMLRGGGGKVGQRGVCLMSLPPALMSPTSHSLSPFISAAKGLLAELKGLKGKRTARDTCRF